MLYPFYEDLKTVRIGTMPNRAYYIPCDPQSPVEGKTNNSRVMMLNGIWDFHFFQSFPFAVWKQYSILSSAIIADTDAFVTKFTLLFSQFDINAEKLRHDFRAIHFAMASSAFCTLPPWMASPGFTTAPGQSFQMSCSLCPMPLPSWVQKGRIGLTRNLWDVMLALTVS